jgi:HlyD family secretion protein
MANTKKLFLFFTFLFIVSGIGMYQLFIKEEVTGVELEPVTLRDIVNSISYSGFIDTESRVLVCSEIPGRVIGVYFDELDYVKEGDVLVKLADDEISAQLKEAKAILSAAKIRLNNSERNLDRVKKLFEKGFIPKEEMERSQLEVDINRAELSKAKSNFELIQARLKNTFITAPISGVVTKKHIEKGEIVAGPLGSKGVSEPVPIAEITDFNSLKVYTDVDEIDIAKIRIGQEAIITADAYPERKLQGKVEEIALVPSKKKEVGTNYRVKVKIKNPAKFLRLGMTTNVDFILSSKKNVLSISRNSVLKDGKSSYVLIIKNGRVYKKSIDIGIEGENYVEVTQGLKPNQMVITGVNLEELKEGQKVYKRP